MTEIVKVVTENAVVVCVGVNYTLPTLDFWFSTDLSLVSRK